MATFKLVSESREAAQILRKALENYASFSQHQAAFTRTRPLNTGESRDKLERVAKTIEARGREAAMMAEQIGN